MKAQKHFHCQDKISLLVAYIHLDARVVMSYQDSVNSNDTRD